MGRCAPSTRSRSRRHLALAGLLLALALLGHDLLMTVSAHAAPPPDNPQARHGQTAFHTGTETLGAGPSEAPGPDHPAGCKVARSAAPRTGGNPAPAGPAGGGDPIGAGVPPLASQAGGGWAEPTSPPSTRRAVFQVYRI